MTAEEDENITGSQNTTAEAQQSSNSQLPQQIIDIFNYLSLNEKIIFKSQQIDDPELQREEKVQIAREIYEKNRETFLMRFGCYMDELCLATFAQLAFSGNAAPLKSDEHDEEIQLMLADYRQRLHTRSRDVKNRRYAAMQKLIKEGDYFSEQEMMKRAPELYQELVGQYLSEAEKKERDSYDVRNTTFSGILMHTMEQKEMQDVLREADERNTKNAIEKVEDDSQNSESSEKTKSFVEEVEEESQSSNSNCASRGANKGSSPCEDEVPASFRQQWGNFDNEQVACSTSLQHPKPANRNENNQLVRRCLEVKQQPANEFITAGERELLRQEFVGLMHEQFLTGKDQDFDYTKVDDDSQLDDLTQLNRDKEDAYFEESDSDDECQSIGQEMSDENNLNGSEDELDVFMTHLSRHHSLQS